MPVAIPLITAAASIGGAAISASGQKSAQKRGAGIQQQGLNALYEAQGDTVNSAGYQNFAELINAFSKNPRTYSDADLAGLKARYAEDAVVGARANQGAAWERAGAQGAYRDGSTRRTEGRIAQRLGSDIAQGNRSVDQMAAQDRVASLAQLGALLQGMFNLRMGPASAIANTSVGVGSNIAGYGASPFGDVLKGIGTLGASGALGSLFGGGGAGGGSSGSGIVPVAGMRGGF